MKGSLIIVGFFVLGIIFGLAGWLNVDSFSFDISFIALALLMFCVGIGVGSDFSALKSLKSQKAGLLLLPLVTIIGTLGGCALVSLFIPGRSMSDVLAVGSGFGYYSLSSIFITEYRGAELGTVALLANISREIVTLLGAPILYKLFGPLAPISSGGATSMDTTLPIITSISGKEFVVLSIYHGFVVDFSVPFLVTFFCSL
nr:lysine exporter LysO family protein [uncultured Duncaniella sp.]